MCSVNPPPANPPRHFRRRAETGAPGITLWHPATDMYTRPLNTHFGLAYVRRLGRSQVGEFVDHLVVDHHARLGGMCLEVQPYLSPTPSDS